MDCGDKPVLVLGATGYVGGRLLPVLLERGWKVRAVGRSAGKIQSRSWGSHPNLEIIVADALDTAALTEAMRGCRAVFYLIHSIRPGEHDFATLDRRIAYSAVQAARAAGMDWFLYFSGLGNPAHLSEQLRSRYEVGEILALGGARVTQLRAPFVLGSGGASFEMIRAFCGYLRIMLAPRWMDTKCHPIAIANVINYLAGCLEHPETAGQIYEIGGPEVLSWRALFRIYAEEAGLPPRLVLVLPLRINLISIGWMNLVTPVSVALIRPLIERMRDEILCRDERIKEIVPQRLLSCREVIIQALDEVRQGEVASSCFDAGSTRLPEWIEGQAHSEARFFRDTFFVTLDGPPELAWNVVKRIGGNTGWYFGTFLWQVRGFVDKMLGGPGLSRGRRHLDSVGVGDSLDFWRVVAVEECSRLLLRAEMLAPGDAFLEFRVQVLGDGSTELRMTPSFEPRGVWGRVYWWIIAPSHALLFGSMLRQMAKAAGANVLSGPSCVRQC
ncbi:SDR family oxidoreductase [Desulfopila sp. IMCC35006]|uniref:SDR family oxidoreductase n=1 Tax=Desulfopila sp. IMCC35006 TaxID=2569542 RepID=UPI0010ABD041|nr:SDR family oxidoreductase [Desulfopila sp. IMCC35006]TKB27423.1 SDR family oxidoreductase [Desulfopila sp. IMCC35006]